MIGAVIIILAVLAYVLWGYGVFIMAVDALGGKETYLREISDNGKAKCNAQVAYILAMIFVSIGWPYFVIAAFLHKED